MYTSLSQFYCSDEWRNLRAALLVERISKHDGILHDEYNGAPLMRSMDIVAHHKEPLTLQNVNDYSISLNPDNIMLVSHRSHNEIHARFGFSSYKKVYYVYGAPCSGKSTYVKECKGNSDLVIDIDLIWQALTGGALYFKPDALKAAVFAVRDSLFDTVRTRAGNWERAWLIEGGAQKAARMRRIAAFDAEPIFIPATKEDCLSRLASDENRTNVQDAWAQYICEWFDQYQQ